MSFVGGPEISEKEVIVTRILEPLIEECGERYDYILIDNQAGYTNTSAAGVTVASKVIVVSEADLISSDAVDNLVALIGSDMPKFRRYLINKVEIREAGDYQAKVEAFKTMNRLPPLPFDFSIRNAFGDREIPVDLSEPTSFLIALFATVKEILPENKKRFEKYENERVAKLFDRYQDSLDSLLEERAEMQERIVEFGTIEKRRETGTTLFIYRLAVLISVCVSAVATIVLVGYKLAAENEVLRFFSYGVVAALVISTGGMSVRLLVRRSRELIESAKLEEERSKDTIRLQRKLADLEPQVARYRNLIATRSRELLIDFDKYSEHRKSNMQ
jgi:MinD-like ATPase involved in chromosome partitioning or flagellar assembly